MAVAKRAKKALFYDPESGDMRLQEAAAPAVFQVLNQRWSLLVLRALADGPLRFNELAKQTRINPNTLRERLRDLETFGVVDRIVHSVMPPNVEYRLSASGIELAAIFHQFDDWAIRHAVVAESNSAVSAS